MKKLLILRHAKSSWKEPSLSDFQRPLNKRGTEAAPRMGGWIAQNNLVPDTILCSTAVRAQETMALAIEGGPLDSACISTEELYLAPPQAYLENLAQLPESQTSAMVIGHNPGIEELVYQLCGEYRVMPTCALAVIDLQIAQWDELFSSSVSGELSRYILVRDLE